MNPQNNIAKLLDHALLHPTMTDDQLRIGCEQARKLGVATVCVKPYAISIAQDVLTGSDIGIGTVIGFPHGSSTTDVKSAEAQSACRAGATELDMVVNVGKVLSGDWDYVKADIQAVADVALTNNVVLKVIFETDYVTAEEDKIRLCRLCEELGVDYVKTSTGFGFVEQPDGNYNYVGATEADVRLMRETCGPGVGVKASGGIRTFEDAVKMGGLGATRLGTSSSETILAGQVGQKKGR